MNNLRNLETITIINKTNFNNQLHLEFPICSEYKEELFNYLLNQNIDIRKFFYRNLSELKCYKKYKNKSINSEIMEKSILLLPCYPNFSNRNIYRIINEIKNFNKNNVL